MNEKCKRCEERGNCERTLSIGEFLKRLLETDCVPVIHECPFHYDLEEDKYDLEGDEEDE